MEWVLLRGNFLNDDDRDARGCIDRHTNGGGIAVVAGGRIPAFRPLFAVMAFHGKAGGAADEHGVAPGGFVDDGGEQVEGLATEERIGILGSLHRGVDVQEVFHAPHVAPGSGLRYGAAGGV
jgi:hypothetical protein